MSNAHSPIILDAKTTLEVSLNGVKLIEANAGTGKTYTIANLYLRHIIDGKTPAEILVVTFTNAATEELRGRIRARIYDTLQLLNQPAATDDEFLALLLLQWQALDTETQQRQTRCLQLALRCMDEASIFTIHGFCQRALTDHALSSGQPFDVTLLSDDLPLWEQALKDWWRRQSYNLSSKDWSLFHSCLGDLSALLSAQKDLNTDHQATILPEVKQDLDELFLQWHQLEKSLQGLASAWQTRKIEVLETLQNSKTLKRTRALPWHKDNLAHSYQLWDAYFGSHQLLEIPGSLHYLGRDTLIKESTPAKRGSDPKLETGFFALAQQVLNKIDQLKNRFKVRALIEANVFAQHQVRTIKQQNRSIAYQDQLSLLLEALQGTAELGQQLRARFPVALIDEFQDTDAIQFGIFRRLYFDQEEFSLTMIGDPKQAIYSFRGGDIYTYIKAKQEPCVEHFSLLTNWRSEARLIDAVNTVFTNRPAAFIYADSIDFVPVQAATSKQPSPLLIDDRAVAPLTIWKIPQNQQQKNQSSRQTYRSINAAIADEIARLIRGGQQNTTRLGDRPLVSGDIAVLVRTALEGNSLRAVLYERGIRAVTIGKDKVFDSDEASGLYELLLAINHFTDRRLLRASLTSGLLSFDYLQIAAICDNESAWQHWCELIRNLHLLWLQKGFIAMFQQLLQVLEIGERIAESDFAERRLTNLLHLAELAQHRSRVNPGFDALLAWYRDQIAETTMEDTELRLENDEELVKIVTIHKSKGLEYSVVFVPFLWTCRPRQVKPGSVLRFHDQHHNPVIDLGSDDHAEHAFIAEKERLAEDIRLAYVAITRARARVYLAWGDVGDGKMSGQPAKTALGYLLHSRQSADDLNRHLPRAFDSNDQIDKDLEKLAKASQDSIEIIPLPEPADEPKLATDTRREQVLKAAIFKSRLANDWHITSFSGLTREIHQVAHGGSSRSGEDPILDFPAGSHVGLLLHGILEHLDFQRDIKSQCAELLPRFSPRFGLDSIENQNTLSRWMETLMLCPLNHAGLTLSSLSMKQRLNELAFDFALDELDIDKLNRLLTRISGVQLAPVDVKNFRGLVTGIIDLVFEHEGRFYIADYKSNFLGARLEDYTTDKLQAAIYARRYDLQYLLYSIALHRYLALRLPDYQFKQHFGGVYYLFIRAMRPQHGTHYGVFFDLPAYDDLLELDDLLAFAPPTGSLS
ncbi:MAG: exodeoxyribonuclease V subunit beta [Gammaproteobacteria bacterium]|nr:exodeoxyribonuclease V subunit beta [Gammaproteobacteria bacterium]